jgi:beta-glucosidase
MLKSLISTGKPVVFVLMTGSAIGLEWENQNIPAIVNAWYGGQAGGTAVADVLFGDYNPSGKLPVTFYRSVDDLPDFENYDMKGRTYRYFEGKPVYPFGHGLTYTDFRYGKAEVIENEDGSKSLAVKVKNVGKRAGEDVLQLYVSRPDDMEGPLKTLKGFVRFSLEPGESSTVTIPLDEETFTVWNEETGRLEQTCGTYILHYGNTSDDSALKTMKTTVSQDTDLKYQLTERPGKRSTTINDSKQLSDISSDDYFTL